MLPKQPHIQLEKVEEICILCGNPDRVSLISSFLSDGQELAKNRGLVSAKGFTKNKNIPVTVLTTGMGSGSTAIVLEEAYRSGGRVFIRIGSTGSLINDKECNIGSLFIPNGAIRDEGTSKEFIPLEVPAVPSIDIYNLLCNSATELGLSFQSGLVWSTDIYYSKDPEKFRYYHNFGAVCVEMESSTLFSFGLSKGQNVKTASILTADGNLFFNNTIYNGDVHKNKEFNSGMNKSINCVLHAIEKYNKGKKF